MDELWRMRRSEGYGACVDEVRVERCGKSAPAGSEVSGAVNSIRSNTVEGNMTGPVSPGGGWSISATICLDRWLSTTEPGLQVYLQDYHA